MTLELLNELIKNPWYSKCCITGKSPVQFHHNFIFAGRKVEEVWCILPVTKSIHDIEKRRDIKEKLDWIMLNRASAEELKRYSKVENLLAKKIRLNEKYGAFSEK